MLINTLLQMLKQQKCHIAETNEQFQLLKKYMEKCTKKSKIALKK